MRAERRATVPAHSSVSKSKRNSPRRRAHDAQRRGVAAPNARSREERMTAYESVASSDTGEKNRKITRAGIPARSWLTVILCSMYAIFYLDRVNISQSASFIQKDFNLTNTELGLIFSAFSWSYLAGQFSGGWLAYRFGSRRVLFCCALIVGVGPAFPSATLAMRTWYPIRLLGWIQGSTHSFARVGGAIAPPLVAALIL